MRDVNTRASAGTRSPHILEWAWLKVLLAELQDSKERLFCRNRALQFQDPEPRLEPGFECCELWYLCSLWQRKQITLAVSILPQETVDLQTQFR